jgi:microcystin-dependent protein
MGFLGPTPAPDQLRLQAWPTGAILMLAGPAASVPPGFLLCRGQFIQQASYPALFALLSHRYNRDAGGAPVDPGDGTFKLPDFRRRIPMGPGAGRANGQRGGAFDHRHGAGALAISHSHTRGNLRVRDHWHNHDLYVADHNHATSETAKALITGSSSYRGRSFGGNTQGTGNFAMPSGGVARAGEMALGGATAATAPGVKNQSGPGNPPVLTVNFAIRT